jgi:hypothetical protein
MKALLVPAVNRTDRRSCQIRNLHEIMVLRRGMIGPHRHCSYKFLQLLKIDRLGQMMIESGIKAAAHILLHAKAAESDADERLLPFGCAHDVTAVAIGQPDVAD